MNIFRETSLSFLGSSDALLSLVNAGASVSSVDKDGLSSLHCAASRGHQECLETLVSLCGADPDLQDKNGCSALFYAVTLGHAACAEYLLGAAGAAHTITDKKVGALTIIQVKKKQ